MTKIDKSLITKENVSLAAKFFLSAADEIKKKFVKAAKINKRELPGMAEGFAMPLPNKYKGILIAAIENGWNPPEV